MDLKHRLISTLPIVKVRGLCIPKKAGEPSADLSLELNARIQEPWVDLTCDLTKANTYSPVVESSVQCS
jgi:hypothetical protein